MDLPSRSISTALVAPQVLPSGIFAQFSTVAYGFVGSLTGCTSPWVCALPADIVSAVTIASANVNLTRPERVIAVPPLYVLMHLPNGSWGMVNAWHNLYILC